MGRMAEIEQLKLMVKELLKDTALWTSLDNFLHQNYGHEHDGREIIRLVGELRMGGRLNGGDILYLKEIIKFSRVAGMKVVRKAYEEEEKKCGP